QQMTYYEPQTTCCTTTTGAAVTSVPPVTVNPPVTGTPPSVKEDRQPPLTPSPGAPNVQESHDQAPANPEMRFNRKPNDTGLFGQPQLGAPIPVSPGTPSKKPAVRTDRIASRTGEPVLRGQVVGGDQQ